MSDSQFQALIESNRRLNKTVEMQISQINSTLDSSLNNLNNWKDNVKSIDLSGQGRYVTKLTVKGDKDTFYPVIFTMNSGDETVIQIYRAYAWNANHTNDPSDFDATHVASALVILKGQANPWHGDANYLRTVVNFQRYRQCVAQVGFQAWCEATKKDPAKPDTGYNSNVTGYLEKQCSSFMLRGGNLTYEVYSNYPINFRLMNDGDVISEHDYDHTNVKWVARTVALADAESGDENNNHGVSYIGYASKSDTISAVYESA
ncbi:hypothetical protein [Xenorhabdus sp. PB30.3]|uniref:hypothetical protein n=1 Tax=Xenorhabdus sp. PB30.3 TaxID=2788941 RepID=UPI001E3A310D|nr:hypothetical protein [Xenorhabdus sp. PB30.3]MCC8380057.1 hypothetical protein [Xenorhabdus sp. PB30.3]